MLTCGHKTVGVKWLFEQSAIHKLLVTVDTNTARFPKRFIHVTIVRKNRKRPQPSL